MEERFENNAFVILQKTFLVALNLRNYLHYFRKNPNAALSNIIINIYLIWPDPNTTEYSILDRNKIKYCFKTCVKTDFKMLYMQAVLYAFIYQIECL